MTLTVREILPDEIRAYLEVHRAAVRGTAARDYSADVIEAWAPLPVTEAAVEQARVNGESERRVVAIKNNEIIGMGSVVPAGNELRACYVSPRSGRSGVGTAIVRLLEEIARKEDTPFLELHSSVTAEPFYRAQGYTVEGRGTHIMSSGVPMDCVMMRKDLCDRSDLAIERRQPRLPIGR